MKIGVIGLGVVGSAVRFGFERLGHEVRAHDLKLGTTIDEVLDTDIVYLSVPTPRTATGSCDTSIVESVVAELAEKKYGNIVVIKSTVAPGTTDKLRKLHPTLSLSFVPEFLRERYALSDFMENHDLCIIGTDDDAVFERIRASHGKYPKKFVRLTPLEAEIAKYFNNLYNATLITFANSFYDVCNSLGANYSAVKNALVERDHIFDRYLDCNESFRGFGGVCLPKDLDAIIALGSEKGVDVAFFEQVKNQNRKYRTTVPDGMRLNSNDPT